jgi:hypothetical protein
MRLDIEVVLWRVLASLLAVATFYLMRAAGLPEIAAAVATITVWCWRP